MKLKKLLPVFFFVGIVISFTSCNGKHTSESDQQADSMVLNNESMPVVDDRDNEIYSIKKFLYTLFYIEYEGEPFVTPATKAEFKKYGVNTSVPGLGEPKSLDEIYSPYFTEDYKKNKNNLRPGVAIWGGSNIDIEDPYDLIIDDVIFNEDGTVIAVIKSGESYNDGIPFSIELYTLKKEDGKWKITKIEQAG